MSSIILQIIQFRTFLMGFAKKLDKALIRDMLNPAFAGGYAVMKLLVKKLNFRVFAKISSKETFSASTIMNMFLMFRNNANSCRRLYR